MKKTLGELQALAARWGDIQQVDRDQEWAALNSEERDQLIQCLDELKASTPPPPITTSTGMAGPPTGGEGLAAVGKAMSGSGCLMTLFITIPILFVLAVLFFGSSPI